MDTGSSIWRNKGEAYSTKVKHPHCETQGREYYTVGMLRVFLEGNLIRVEGIMNKCEDLV